jgi:nucleotide-binding universal stress UspA family protein
MQRILVGYDGSEQARHALDQAICLAKHFQAPLTVLTAAADRLVRSDGMITLAADEEAGQHCADQGASRAREAGVASVETCVSLESPDDALVLEAGKGYDLLVVGHRGVGALQELLMGSTAKQVVDRVNCSVLVVR